MINLLPYKEKKIIGKIRLLRVLNSIIGAVFFLITSLLLLILPTVFTVNSRFNIYSEEIISLEKKGMISSDINLVFLYEKAQKIKPLLVAQNDASIIDTISLVEKQTPFGIKIERFSSEDPKILEVFGSFDKRESLKSFIATLTSQPEFSMVDSPVSNFIKSKNGTFKLIISIK